MFVYIFILLQSLILLNIAGNELNHLEDSVFYSLANLIHLDLSHNFKLKFTSTRQIFNGLQESLLFLGLQNVSLTTVRSNIYLVFIFELINNL